MLHSEGVALTDFVEKYSSRVGLLGQVDTKTLRENTPEDVYNQSMDIMKDGAGKGGFILSASCDVPPATKPENLKAMVLAARDFRY